MVTSWSTQDSPEGVTTKTQTKGTTKFLIQTDSLIRYPSGYFNDDMFQQYEGNNQNLSDTYASRRKLSSWRAERLLMIDRQTFSFWSMLTVGSQTACLEVWVLRRLLWDLDHSYGIQAVVREVALLPQVPAALHRDINTYLWSSQWHSLKHPKNFTLLDWQGQSRWKHK
jgi:hypothetical protein